MSEPLQAASGCWPSSVPCGCETSGSCWWLTGDLAELPETVSATWPLHLSNREASLLLNLFHILTVSTSPCVTSQRKLSAFKECLN